MSASKVCRVGDTAAGTCHLHTPPVGYTAVYDVGSPNVTADGKAVVRIGDSGPASCGHHVKAIAGASDSFADGIAIHRLGDATTMVEGSGPGVCTSASPNVDAV